MNIDYLIFKKEHQVTVKLCFVTTSEIEENPHQMELMNVHM